MDILKRTFSFSEVSFKKDWMLLSKDIANLGQIPGVLRLPPRRDVILVVKPCWCCGDMLPVGSIHYCTVHFLHICHFFQQFA